MISFRDYNQGGTAGIMVRMRALLSLLGCACLVCWWLFAVGEIRTRPKPAQALAGPRSTVKSQLEEAAPPALAREVAELVEHGDGFVRLPEIRWAGSRAHIAEKPAPLRLIGQVVDAASREPLAGARIALEASQRFTDLALPATWSGEYGHFELTLEQQSREFLAEYGVSAPSTRIGRAERSADQHASQTDALLASLSSTPPEPYELSLVLHYEGFVPARRPLNLNWNGGGTYAVGVLGLQAGTSIAGRIFGQLDEPVRGAEVRLVDAFTQEIVGRDWTRWDGEYLFPNPPEGVYHVHARADGQGANVLRDLHLAGLSDERLPDLFLRGFASLRGQILGRDGRRLEGLSVQALPVEFADQDNTPISAAILLEQESRGGLFISRGVTDANGEFHLNMLQSTAYELSWDGQNGLVDATVVEAPHEGLELLSQIQRLRVSVRRQTDALSQSAGGFVLCSRLDKPTSEAPGVVIGGNGTPYLGSAVFLTVPGSGKYEVSLERDGKTFGRTQVQIQNKESELWVTLLATEPPLEGAPGNSSAGGEPRRARAQEALAAAAGVVRILLEWNPAPPPDLALAPIEARLDRLGPAATAEMVEARWNLLHVGPGDETSAQTATFEGPRLGAGIYRLRLRSEGEIFHDSRALHQPPGALIFRCPATLPKDHTQSAR